MKRPSYLQCERGDRGVTHVTHQLGQYPVKFLSRQSRGRSGNDRDCAQVTVLNYGGGILGGEHLEIRVGIGVDATAHLTTPGATKIYKQDSGGGRSEQVFHIRGREGSLTAFLPHHVTAFENAAYRQIQRFELEKGASLVVLDWLSSGRCSRGERWAFRELQSANQVSYDGRILLNDALELKQESLMPGVGSVECRLRGYEMVGAIFAIGRRVAPLVEHLLAIRRRQSYGDIERSFQESARKRMKTEEKKEEEEEEDEEEEVVDWDTWKDEGVRFSICELRSQNSAHWSNEEIEVSSDSLYMLRFSAKSVSQAYSFVRFSLSPIEKSIGVRPFSVARPS